MEISAFKVKIFQRISEYLEKHHSQYYSGYLAGLFDCYSMATGQDFYDLRTEFNQWARAHNREQF